MLAGHKRLVLSLFVTDDASKNVIEVLFKVFATRALTLASDKALLYRVVSFLTASKYI
jgi:hypothetical protein